MNLNQYLREKKLLVEENLQRMLPKDSQIPIINDAMRYSLHAGGKRLRPILSIMAGELFSGDSEDIIDVACCIEMIHTYSLIHDDLPAMDNDDFRRGKPTNHKVFGEGFAILAGDALLNYAFEVLMNILVKNPEERYIKAAAALSKACGVMGMIGGQCIDLFYENKEIDIEVLKEMHSKKTGALIAVSLEVGAILSKADQGDIDRIMEYGRLIGAAFQIEDDILDVEGSIEKLGKTIGSDINRKKSTYVSFYGLDKAKEMARKKVEDAKALLSIYGEKAIMLKELADYIVNREE